MLPRIQTVYQLHALSTPSPITHAKDNSATPSAHLLWSVRLRAAGSATVTLPQLHTLLLTSSSSLLEDLPVAQIVKNLPAMQETRLWSLGQEDPWRREPTPVFLPGEVHGQRRLGATVRGAAKSWMRLSD